ncbi:MAG: hypothetical protein KGO96_10270 [Elusimicrobia bacterium]|nr:hypothetical protein [Elusimicrobiota bacterium]
MSDDYSLFPSAHQESIAVVIALCDDANSSIVANLVELELFDPPYRDIVARCLEYRRTYRRPPGKSHVDDVFADVMEDRKHKSYSQYRTVIANMVELSDRINTEYVRNVVAKFIHTRRHRANIAQLVERYQKGGDSAVEDLEEIHRQALRIRQVDRDYGFSLADDRALQFLDRDEGDYCKLGIRELDNLLVVPTKRELLAFLSPPNRGKSFFLVHCGKAAFLKGWKVAHYTLENSDDMTAQRYFMALFGGVRRSGTYRATFMDEAKDGAFSLRSEVMKPSFVIEDAEDTRQFLLNEMGDKKREYRRNRLANLRIRRFPSGRMSFEMLEQDLDELKLLFDFEPDMLMVDMPSLMKMPKKDRDYAAEDELNVMLRGLAVERNMAVVVPKQGNRSSNAARNVQAQHSAGTFGLFGVADNEITYSQTPAEEQYGLARLYTQKVRNDRARMTILISQHYDTGQFCVDSRLMTARARRAVEDFVGQDKKAANGKVQEDEEEEAED